MRQEVVLAMLAKEPSHGYELRTRLGRALGPVAEGISESQMYVTLTRLEKGGFVARADAPSERSDRKVYCLTPAGQERVTQWLSDVSWPRPDLAEFHMKLVAAAQSRLAHEYGYRNWAELMTAVASMLLAGNGGANPSRPPGSPPISQSGANVFPLLPLRGLVTFPHVSYPIFVGRAKSICAVEHALDRKLPIVLAAQKDATNADPLSSDMYQVGVLAKVIQSVRLSRWNH